MRVGTRGTFGQTRPAVVKRGLASRFVVRSAAPETLGDQGFDNVVDAVAEPGVSGVAQDESYVEEGVDEDVEAEEFMLGEDDDLDDEFWSDPETDLENFGPEEIKSLFLEIENATANTVLQLQEGDVISGTVVNVQKSGGYIEWGGYCLAYAPADNLSTSRISDANKVLAVGMEREFTVVGFSRKEEVPLLSMAEQQRTLAWQRFRQLQDFNVTLAGTVVSSNRGGLVVDVLDTMGFIPNTHLGPVADKDIMVEDSWKLPLKILEVDEENEKVLMSARLVHSGDTLDQYRVGDVVEGVVTKITVYGAFLELENGITGLLHISQVSHDRVLDLTKLINPGDRMKVMIMSQDRQRERLALSTKKLEPTPGDMLKNPALVFERAEEMAELFKIRVAAVEKATREEEEKKLAEQLGAQGELEDAYPMEDADPLAAESYPSI